MYSGSYNFKVPAQREVQPSVQSAVDYLRMCSILFLPESREQVISLMLLLIEVITMGLCNKDYMTEFCNKD